VAAFGLALQEWMPDPTADLDSLLTAAFDDLRDALA
jgi:hypothetical protein